MDNLHIIFENQNYDIHDFHEFIGRLPDKNYGRTVLLMKRNQELIFTILHLMNQKRTFIPVDPTLPIERIQYIINDTKADFIYNNTDVFLDPLSYNNGHGNKTPSENIAYILYTSGSTGYPKGVKITRDALFNFMDGVSEVIDFSAGKRIACFTTVSFDIFLLESIAAVWKGLTVVLANEKEQYNPKLMAQLIQDQAVDMIQMTPSRMQLLLNYDKTLSCLKHVKEIMIGGEPFPLTMLRDLQKKTTAKIYNMYGPTETTIWSTICDLTHEDQISVGYPIKNTKIYIVNNQLSILPDGQAGEICIAGKGVASGYVGRKDLTAEKFVYLPEKPNIRVYRTGDVGRILPNGSLEYLGRTDNQVKLRGHRIELEEIESNLNQFEGVKQSIVTTLKTSETDLMLEAFYVSDYYIQPKVLMDFLSRKLPSYMIPITFKQVKKFFYTENGKIDRKRVPECEEIEKEDFTLENVRDLNPMQRQIFEAILAILDPRIHNVTLDSNFVRIGVDSLTFIEIITELENKYKFSFEDDMLFIDAYPTIRSMVEYVEHRLPS